jgi:hypothetical protein
MSLCCTGRQLAGSFFNRHEIILKPYGLGLSQFVRKQFQLLFHWVSHPSFHLSLAVLVHYRSLYIFSLGGWFPRILPMYLHRDTWDSPRGQQSFVYRTFTFFGQPFQIVLLLY